MSGTNETVEQHPPTVTTTSRGDAERHRGLNPIAGLTAAVAILVVVIVAIAGIAYGRSTKSTSTGTGMPATITVTGSGTVQGAPDTVSFNVSIHTIARTATGALTISNRRLDALEATLHHIGVPLKGLQTSGLSI